MGVKLLQTWTVSVNDEDVGKIDYTDYLDDGETVATVDSLVPSDAVLTANNGQVNDAVVRILNRNVAVGKAVLFNYVSTAAGTYTVDVTTTTSTGRVAVRTQTIVVE